MKTSKKSILHFTCTNDKCNKKIDADVFKSTAAKWGYILLTSESNFLFGLTCPDCMTTTVLKFTSKLLIQTEDIVPENKFYVPFVAPEPMASKGRRGKNRYIIPDIFQRIDSTFTRPGVFEWGEERIVSDSYPKWFVDKCRYDFALNEIKSIVDYENNNKIKVFPRIIHQHTPYSTTDRILYRFNTSEFKDDEDVENIDKNVNALAVNEFLIKLISNYVKSTVWPSVKNVFSDQEINDLKTPYMLANDYSDDFLKSMPEIINFYLKIRNDFRFEDIYQKEFIYKYAMKLYHEYGYGKSAQRVRDKEEYSDYYNTKIENLNLIKNEAIILTDIEIKNRWGKGDAVIKKFIISGKLSAYNPNGDLVENKLPAIQNNAFDTSDFLFLSSDIEELELLNPWLNKENNSVPQDHPINQTIDQPIVSISEQNESLSGRESEAIPPESKDKTRHSKKVRERCIELAIKLWDEAKSKGEPILSTGAMAKHPAIVKIAIKKNRENYEKDTIQKWLSPTANKYGADNPGMRAGTRKKL